MLSVERDFSPVQKLAVRDVLQYRRFYVSSEMGFGKTAVVLAAARYLADKGKASLVIAEASAVGTTWATEHEKWDYMQTLKVCVLKGTQAKRLKLLKQGGWDVYVISYNSLKWLVDNAGHLPDLAAVFCDEANKIKGHSSKFRKHVMKLAAGADIRIGVTGTPRANSEIDFYGLMQFIDDGAMLGRTWEEFRLRYTKQLQVGKQVTIDVIRSKKVAKQIRDMCKPYFRNYALSENATVPIEKVIVPFNLSPQSQAIYDEFMEAGMTALRDYVDLTGEELKPMTKVHLLNKLSLLSSGFVYRYITPQLGIEHLRQFSADELLAMRERETVELFHDRIVVLDELVSHIRANYRDGIVICYNAKHELEQLRRQYPDAMLDTDKDFVPRWNNREADILLLQYNRSSKSLNLQHGGNVVIFYSMVFNFVDSYQIVRRVARQGQKADRVYLYVLVANGTRDEDKIKKVDEREELHLQFGADTVIQV